MKEPPNMAMPKTAINNKNILFLRYFCQICNNAWRMFAIVLLKMIRLLFVKSTFLDILLIGFRFNSALQKRGKTMSL